MEGEEGGGGVVLLVLLTTGLRLINGRGGAGRPLIGPPASQPQPRDHAAASLIFVQLRLLLCEEQVNGYCVVGKYTFVDAEPSL